MRSQVIRTSLTFLVWGSALGLAYGQTPLFTSNQNQYFLHGLAQSGIGQLEADWLANTRDPTPLFTLLVRLMAIGNRGSLEPVGSPLPLGIASTLNYLLYLLIFGVYLAGAFGIADRLYGLRQRPTRALLFLGLLFTAHSAALRYALTRLPAGEWAYLFDGGLGGQRLLGPVFQPSVFGALLLLSIWLQLVDRPLPAMWLTAVAASYHPTYLLSAAILSAVYWVAWIRRSEQLRRPIFGAASTLALVLPIVAYAMRSFFPPSEVAQRILVEFRIPDHALPSEWFDLASVFQLTWMASALVLARRTRLRPVILALLGVGGGLTAWQLLAPSDNLALLFPWRTSATLVPLATAVALGWIARRLTAGVRPASVAASAGSVGTTPLAAVSRASPGERDDAPLLSPRLARGLGLGLVLLSVVSGIGWSAVQFEQRRSMPQRDVLEYVRRTKSAGELYLVPAKMQDFRLATGAPILADFKAIPYYGPEVLEWHQRVRLLGFFYRSGPEQVDCGLLDVFAGEYGVTHVVTEPDQHGLACDRLELQYDGRAFSVYRIQPDA